MASDVFIDTSGFYSLLVREDDRHAQAGKIMRAAAETKRRFVTSDYVVDETATLFQARGLSKLMLPLFESIFASSACRMIWMDADRFHRTRAHFLRNLERDWSFTDCASFVIMKELRLREALTKDSHFDSAGFVALLGGPH
jgi:uncharacterized protein